MSRPRKVPHVHLVKWGAVVTALTAYNIAADRNEPNGDTFSETVRYTFRTDTVVGKAALCGVWAVLTCWVIPHWLNVPEVSK